MDPYYHPAALLWASHCHAQCACCTEHGVTFGASSATCENTFSTLTNIFSQHRRSMLQPRKAHLIQLVFERDLTRRFWDGKGRLLRKFNTRTRRLQLCWGKVGDTIYLVYFSMFYELWKRHRLRDIECVIYKRNTHLRTAVLYHHRHFLWFHILTEKKITANVYRRGMDNIWQKKAYRC